VLGFLYRRVVRVERRNGLRQNRNALDKNKKEHEESCYLPHCSSLGALCRGDGVNTLEIVDDGTVVFTRLRIRFYLDQSFHSLCSELLPPHTEVCRDRVEFAEGGLIVVLLYLPNTVGSTKK
jgi:hypothetical protein